MRDVWKYALGVGALLLAVFVAAWLAARGRGDDSRRVLADGFEGMAKRRLDKLRAEYEHAASDARVDSSELHESAARFDAERAKLQASYERLGLSADEIERRFTGLRL